jgi:hypothetical protein
MPYLGVDIEWSKSAAVPASDAATCGPPSRSQSLSASTHGSIDDRAVLYVALAEHETSP